MHREQHTDVEKKFVKIAIGTKWQQKKEILSYLSLKEAGVNLKYAFGIDGNKNAI
ncbi:hypothetical protein [Chitinophaga caeni]|uniref:hypothetical protein n=1 Tax=Chitinophaga caeni TaxID=2029983 RepID=UPI001E2E0AAB|nr:hypothetical protein [Chitinophaga caeni]